MCGLRLGVRGASRTAIKERLPYVGAQQGARSIPTLTLEQGRSMQEDLTCNSRTYDKVQDMF